LQEAGKRIYTAILHAVHRHEKMNFKFNINCVKDGNEKPTATRHEW
jgi:hypothetical protein